MKKICVVSVVLCVVQFINAASDIGCSSGAGGYWAYAPDGGFSFVQPIVVDDVQGATTDSLVGCCLYLPNLAVSNFSEQFPGSGVYVGILTPESSAISLKDANGGDILTGTLVAGGVFTVGSSAIMYPTLDLDIIITGLPNTINSAFIDSLQVGWGFNFDLTLQDSSIDLANMILTNQTIEQGSTLSGSMTTIIPEPAALAMLALGSLLLRKRK